MKNKGRVLFVSHGGGPLPLLGDEGHQMMVDCLKHVADRFEKPSAIVVVSAHWEQSAPCITSAAAPSLIYDYYGFPEQSYHIKYSCPGEPVLARRICNLLNHAGFDSKLDEQRGFDHGLFVPLKIMYPNADIPCVQLSLLDNLDPAEHIKMGRSLQELDDENVLLLGSGFTFHNMNAFFAPDTRDSKTQNLLFENWLLQTCCDPELDEEERSRRLIDWTNAPAARYCHPREEHLLPLHVCYGLAGRACPESFELEILNKKSSIYLW